MPDSETATFLPRAQAALAAFAARPGYLRGRIGRAADDPTQWVLTTEWTGVGAYRRSLGAYDVKVDAAPLLSLGRDEPSAFEVLHADDRAAPAVVNPSRRAHDADEVGIGSASGPASSG
ncbi:MAG: antibiotic biosynthesis monooxygenase [Frankiales bacterium]|nr:antibiotic biosynthesis monooxygenase [Frankiales bacterium]